jgi:hypothetical protein
VDRRLTHVRLVLARRLGDEFLYYDLELARQWQLAPTDRWKEFTKWMRRFLEWDGFDAAAPSH